MNIGIYAVLLFTIFITLLTLGPFAIIWAANTLLGPLLSIPYNFWTWLAVVIFNVRAVGIRNVNFYKE